MQEGNLAVNGSNSASNMYWRGQGSLTAPTQPSLLPNAGNYLRFHEEIAVTANQNTRINVNSSTSLEARGPKQSRG